MAKEIELDFDLKYQVDDYPGVAWNVLGYEKVRYDDYTWSGLEHENRERVRAVMVGDDRVFTFETDQLTSLTDTEYCNECGQIGCTADGR